jgi:hypothetical protein
MSNFNKAKSLKKINNIYFELNKIIKTKYSFLDNKYKNVKSLFELQFRLYESGKKKAVNNNLKKFKNSTNFYKIFFKIFIKVYSNLFNFFFKKPCIFMRAKSLSRSAETDIKTLINKNKIKTLGTASMGSGWIEKLRYVYLNTWIYDALELASEVRHVLKMYECDNADRLIKLVKLDTFVSKINKAFEADKNFISEVLKNFCIRGLLLHTDQTLMGYTMIQAAKKKNIKTAVLCHGTAGDPLLISILPAHAKKIFVWTKYKEKHINSCNKFKVAEFVDGIKANVVKIKTAKSIVIIGDPWFFLNRNLERRFVNFIERLKEKNKSLSLIYCPHPSDRNEVTKTKIIKLGLEWSKNTTYKVAESAKIVIGGASSFLFESHCSGIPTFQLKELFFNYTKHLSFKELVDHWKIEGVQQVTYKDFLKNFESIIKQDLNIKKITEVDAKPIVNFFKSEMSLHE